MNRRIIYIIATFILLAIEVVIALFIHDNYIRPYVGDVLVVIVIYTLIRIFLPSKPRLLPLYVFCFAVGTELLQYFEIVKWLGLEDNTFFRILIGSVFDVRDIICYGAGCIILAVYECMLSGRTV